jgi:hypothetical protein
MNQINEINEKTTPERLPFIPPTIEQLITMLNKRFRRHTG